MWPKCGVSKQTLPLRPFVAKVDQMVNFLCKYLSIQTWCCVKRRKVETLLSSMNVVRKVQPLNHKPELFRPLHRSERLMCILVNLLCWFNTGSVTRTRIQKHCIVRSRSRLWSNQSLAQEPMRQEYTLYMTPGLWRASCTQTSTHTLFLFRAADLRTSVF